MKVGLWIETKVTGKDGNVIHRTRRRKSHSYVQAWNWLLCAQFLGASSPSPALSPVPDTGGANRALRTCGAPLRVHAGAGTTIQGIRVGTSTAAVAIGQYALQASIAEGTGSGQMEHQAMTWNWIGVVGNVCSFKTERVIVNNSGAQINVREAGIYMMGFDIGTVARYFMATRDLISEDVPNGGSVTVTYTVRILA